MSELLLQHGTQCPTLVFYCPGPRCPAYFLSVKLATAHCSHSWTTEPPHKQGFVNHWQCNLCIHPRFSQSVQFLRHLRFSHQIQEPQSAPTVRLRDPQVAQLQRQDLQHLCDTRDQHEQWRGAHRQGSRQDRHVNISRRSHYTSRYGRSATKFQPYRKEKNHRSMQTSSNVSERNCVAPPTYTIDPISHPFNNKLPIYNTPSYAPLGNTGTCDDPSPSTQCAPSSMSENIISGTRYFNVPLMDYTQVSPNVQVKQGKIIKEPSEATRETGSDEAAKRQLGDSDNKSAEELSCQYWNKRKSIPIKVSSSSDSVASMSSEGAAGKQQVKGDGKSEHTSSISFEKLREVSSGETSSSSSDTDSSDVSDNNKGCSKQKVPQVTTSAKKLNTSGKISSSSSDTESSDVSDNNKGSIKQKVPQVSNNKSTKKINSSGKKSSSSSDTESSDVSDNNKESIKQKVPQVTTSAKKINKFGKISSSSSNTESSDVSDNNKGCSKQKVAQVSKSTKKINSFGKKSSSSSDAESSDVSDNNKGCSKQKVAQVSKSTKKINSFGKKSSSSSDTDSSDVSDNIKGSSKQKVPHVSNNKSTKKINNCSGKKSSNSSDEKMSPKVVTQKVVTSTGTVTIMYAQFNIKRTKKASDKRKSRRQCDIRYLSTTYR